MTEDLLGPVVLDEEEVKERMSGNLCRCGAYANIVPAVTEAAITEPAITRGVAVVNPFRYERATEVATAVAAVAERPTAVFLGGGTNLVDLMKLGLATPDLLVDVNRLALDGVEPLPGGGLGIGAGVRNSVLAADATVRARYLVLSQALLSGASGQLRNLATTAGNLLQRTGCVYFQDVTVPCNKREPGSGCPAVEGYNRYMAVLGASEQCVAGHPSDMAVAMAALDAAVRVTGPAGGRVIPAAELHRLPGEQPWRDTALEAGELITAVDLPDLAVARWSRYRKVRDRASYAFALVSVAAALEVAEDGTVIDVRLALGRMAHKPWWAWRAEDELRGAPATEDSFRRAAQSELVEARALSGNAFKVPLAANAVAATQRELTAKQRAEREKP